MMDNFERMSQLAKKANRELSDLVKLSHKIIREQVKDQETKLKYHEAIMEILTKDKNHGE